MNSATNEQLPDSWPPPSHNVGAQEIPALRFSSPFGGMVAAADNNGVCLLEFDNRVRLPAQVNRLEKQLRKTFTAGQHPLLQQLQAELGEYFAGQRQEFNVKLQLVGTPFQQSVWQALLAIPYAATRSYAAQAGALGRPTAVRAVARANGQNALAIVVPCHRVLGKDGSLTGYAGGVERKRALLALEAKVATADE